MTLHLCWCQGCAWQVKRVRVCFVLTPRICTYAEGLLSFELCRWRRKTFAPCIRYADEITFEPMHSIWVQIMHSAILFADDHLLRRARFCWCVTRRHHLSPLLALYPVLLWCQLDLRHCWQLCYADFNAISWPRISISWHSHCCSFACFHFLGIAATGFVLFPTILQSRWEAIQQLLAVQHEIVPVPFLALLHIAPFMFISRGRVISSAWRFQQGVTFASGCMLHKVHRRSISGPSSAAGIFGGT